MMGRMTSRPNDSSAILDRVSEELVAQYVYHYTEAVLISHCGILNPALHLSSWVGWITIQPSKRD